MGSTALRVATAPDQNAVEVVESDSNNVVEVETTSKGYRARVRLAYATRQQMLLIGAIEVAAVVRNLHEKFPELEGKAPVLSEIDEAQLEAIIEAPAPKLPAVARSLLAMAATQE